RSWSNTPFSSISFTSGRTFSSANCRMLSRNMISSSVKEVRGEGGGDCSVVSAMENLQTENGEPWILTQTVPVGSGPELKERQIFASPRRRDGVWLKQQGMLNPI